MGKEKWMLVVKGADCNMIAKKHGISPITAKLLTNRDIAEQDIEEFLYGTIASLHDPFLLKDIDKASDIIINKVKTHKRIRTIGDYDIDGITSSYILLHSLKFLGAHIDAHLPDRVKDGYGLNKALVTQAFDDGIDTILTCDNGIAAYEEIKYAKELGMTVVVTDHHEVPFNCETDEQILPPSDACVDPKRRDCSYPFPEICGAVVALKLVEAIYKKEQSKIDVISKYLEFAAIATIGDVCPLKGENRIIVKEGLKKLAATDNAGLQALISVNELSPASITTYQIGFVIGPCLNASGRLDTAEKALALLLAETEHTATALAHELFELNARRKELTEQGIIQATEIVENTSIKDDLVLVVYLKECHESLAGIIAGRIRERYNKPTFVLTDSADGLKGSGRSIDAFDMFANLTKCGHLFTKFGGHPLAAGLSMPSENLYMFRQLINSNSGLTDSDIVEKILIDAPIPISYTSNRLVEEINMLKPFGQGNRSPLFAQKSLRILNPVVVGKRRNVVKMKVTDGNGFKIDAVYFGDAEKFMEDVEESQVMSLAYYPTINTFRDVSTLQLTITNYFI